MRSPGSSHLPQSYSVFVGHLSLEVTKADLQHLFEDCGVIHEVYIMKPSTGMCFTFGFVRFRDLQDAKQSIKDLNGWMLKGNRMTVEIARETSSYAKPSPENLTHRAKRTELEMPGPRRSHGETRTDNMVGLKNLARLRDSCSVINFDSSRKSETEHYIDMDELLTDVSGETYCRPPAQSSKLYDIDDSMERCLEQLRECNCGPSCVVDKKASEFMKSMRLIINNISNFLDTADHTSNNSDLCNGSYSECNLKPETTNKTSSQTLNNTEKGIKDEILPGISEPKTFNTSIQSSMDDSGHCTEEGTGRAYSSSDDSFSSDNVINSTDFTKQKVLGRGRDLSGAKQATQQQPTSRFIGRGCALAISSETKLQHNHW